MVFDLGTILSGFFDVGSAAVPYFIVVFAVEQLPRPAAARPAVRHGRPQADDRGTYLVSAALVAVLGFLLLSGSLDDWSFMRWCSVTFFLASAGASSAYLTVSEIFPLETRALAIALFFAVGTAVGGITGPVLFGQFIHSGDLRLVAVGFFIGAGAMALGGMAELAFGVRAEQRSLEDIATPADRRGGRGGLAQRALSGRPSANAPAPRGVRQGGPRAGAADRRPHGPPPGNASAPGSTADTAERGNGQIRSTHRAWPARPAQRAGPRPWPSGPLDHEIEQVSRALARSTARPVPRSSSSGTVDGRSGGPGRFRNALREAVRESRAKALPGDLYSPAGRSAGHGEGPGKPPRTRDDGGDG